MERTATAMLAQLGRRLGQRRFGVLAPPCRSMLKPKSKSTRCLILEKNRARGNGAIIKSGGVFGRTRMGAIRCFSSQVTNNQEGSQGEGGFGLGGVAVFGLMAAIIGFFYRGHKSTKARVALINELCDKRALAPEEVNEIREENGQSVKAFLRAVEALKASGFSDDSGKRSAPQAFFGSFARALGSEQGTLKSSHLFERLGLSLAEASPNRRVNNDVLLVAASLTVDEHDEQLAKLVFCLFAENCDGMNLEEDAPETGLEDAREKFIASPSFAGAKSGYYFTRGDRGLGYYLDQPKLIKSADDDQTPQGTISADGFRRAVDALTATNQIPVKKRVVEINEYPLKRFEVADADDMIKVALKLTKVCDEEVEKVDRPLDYAAFEKMLFSHGICAWNSCYDPSRRR